MRRWPSWPAGTWSSSTRDTREPVELHRRGHAGARRLADPNQRHLIVANQNGKQLQRIRTDYRREIFTLEPSATIDLAACTTPSGAACQDPTLRPTTRRSAPAPPATARFTFVTLRGGGMFVVDHNTTPMRIVAEYDRAHVDDNGCGEMEVRRQDVREQRGRV